MSGLVWSVAHLLRQARVQVRPKPLTYSRLVGASVQLEPNLKADPPCV